MFCFLSVFSRSDELNGIFKKVYKDKIVVIDVSGSSKQVINGTNQLTKPEYAIDPVDKKYDWCSNCATNYEEHPWITFSIPNKKMKINGYFVRVGCCYSGCCCEEYGYYVRCCLFSWALQVSDDNKTWIDVHNVRRDYDMDRCKEKSYKLEKEYTTSYVRLIQKEPCPGDPPCLTINKLELFGDIEGGYTSNDDEFVSFHDDDDDVSIIGHISKNHNVKFG